MLETLPMRLDVSCIRPTAALTARLRQAAEELGVRLRAVPAPPDAFVSPACPTVILLARGRVLASAVGELPTRELRALLASAVLRTGSHYPDTRLSDRVAKLCSVAGMDPDDGRRQRP